MYSALVEGKYTWMRGKSSYFPVFSNLFRKNDSFVDYENQTDQAAGAFFKWNWVDSRASIYAELYYNDAKQNLRDLFLDTDHSLAKTIGIEKVFKINEIDFLFNWEWTEMEQSASRLIRESGSWYQHGYVYHGYTNKGEVMGSGIGPGSNSHFFSINKFSKNTKIGFAFEIVENDNDFYHEAFANSKDFRRYWKDFNFHVSYSRNFKNMLADLNLIYVRSLNYQWELDDYATPYYHPGKDISNLHLNLKLSYFFN